jgi:hypothetical protein
MFESYLSAYSKSKSMETNKKILIVIILLTGFIFGVSLSTFYTQMQISQGTACSCVIPIPILIPTFSSLGVFIGSIVYYMMFPKTGESKEKFIGTLLELLKPEEREIIKRIINSNGKITQSKLSAEFGKVKTFRILEELKRRGIIEKEQYGKTNTIKLNEKFKILYS